MKPYIQSSELMGAIRQENRARRRRVPLWDRLQGSPTVFTAPVGTTPEGSSETSGLSAGRGLDEVLTLPSGFRFGARLGWFFLLRLCCVFASHVRSLPP
jgi:hypothetical protein